MKRTAITLAGLAILAGCGAREEIEPVPPSHSPRAVMASAELFNLLGQEKARATARQLGDGIVIRIEAAGFRRGSYGLHVHAVGRCDRPSYDSAGPHWNPATMQHGKDNPLGMHKGDLPNLPIDANGVGSLEFTIPGASLSGGAQPMLDSDGAALVIHAGPDDYRTDPSGNSGARIACGAFHWSRSR